MNYIDSIKHANIESKYDLLINGNLNVENAVMIYKNFSGKPTFVNPQGGKRTFSLVLNKEFGERLSDMGWNVKVKEVRDQLEEGEKTRTVSWQDYVSTFATEFDHALIYTEIVVNEESEYPPKIYKVSEFNGEKTMALIPPEQWSRLDESELSIEDLAADMNLSRVQLYRKVKSFTGSTPVELLRTARLKRGYHLLMTTDKSVSEVAYQVGFTAPSYFTKCFKEEYGVLPGDVRH